MTYCSNDVLATHAVFSKLWPEFLERWDQKNYALSLVPYVDFLLELQHHCTYQQKNWNIAELSQRYGRIFGRQKWQSNEDFLVITPVETSVYVITLMETHTYHSGGKPSLCYHLDGNPSSCQETSIHSYTARCSSLPESLLTTAKI